MLSLIATTARGLEEVTATELEELGADAVQVQPATVRFKGSLETLYKANMWLRSASRVLVSAASFTGACSSPSRCARIRTCALASSPLA